MKQGATRIFTGLLTFLLSFVFFGWLVLAVHLYVSLAEWLWSWW